MNKWTTDQAEYEVLLARIADIADKKGYRLNPNQERVMKVLGLMTNNFVASGEYFCPCKQSHPLDTSADATCPCPPWEEEIAKNGHCRCQLFFAAGELLPGENKAND